MRKAAFYYLFVFLILFLAGCAGGESAGLSEQEENAMICARRNCTPPGLMIGRILNRKSKRIRSTLLIEGDESTVYRFIVSGYGSGDKDYEEYFSKERYIESLSDMGLGSLEWGGNHCSFLIRTLEGPVEIYRNRWPMENAYFFDRTVIYFVYDKTLYRLFIHSGQLDKIFTSDQEFFFYPITNVQTMILYPNPDFTKAIETYGADYLPADHPNQYIAYLYNSQTEEMLPFLQPISDTRKTCIWFLSLGRKLYHWMILETENESPAIQTDSRALP